MTKVLVVENEPLVARMYDKALRFDGFDVVIGVGGEEGLKKVKEEKPDIILLDIMMPEPNGIEVLERIKSDPETAEIPVIMLTNLSGRNDIELALSKGALDFWVKSNTKMNEIGFRIRKILNIEKEGERQE